MNNKYNNIIIICISIIITACGNGNNNVPPVPPHVTNNKVWNDNACAIHNDGYATRWSGVVNGVKVTNTELCSKWFPGVVSHSPITLSKSENNIGHSLLSESVDAPVTVIGATLNGGNWIHFGMLVESINLVAYTNFSGLTPQVNIINSHAIPNGSLGDNFGTYYESIIGDSYFAINDSNVTITETNAQSFSNYQFANLPMYNAGKTGGIDYYYYSESVTKIIYPSMPDDGDTTVSVMMVYLWQNNVWAPITLVTSVESQVQTLQMYAVNWNSDESSNNPYNCKYTTNYSQTAEQTSSMQCTLPNTNIQYSFSLSNAFTNLNANSSSGGSVCVFSNNNNCSQNGWILDYSVTYPASWPTGSYESTCSMVSYSSSTQTLNAACPDLIQSYNLPNPEMLPNAYHGQYALSAALTSPILDYSSCEPGSSVNNVYGNLVCNTYPSPTPQGNYTASCYKVSYDSSTGVLSTNCGAGKLSFNYSSLCAPGSNVNVINNNLICASYNPNLGYPTGSYLSGCYNLSLNSGIISGTCSTGLISESNTIGLTYVDTSLNYTNMCANGSSVNLISNTVESTYISAGNLLCGTPGSGATESAIVYLDASQATCAIVMSYTGATPPAINISSISPLYPAQAQGCTMNPVSVQPTCYVAASSSGSSYNYCSFPAFSSQTSSGLQLWVYQPTVNPLATITVTSPGYQPLNITSSQLSTCLSTVCQ